MFLCNNQQGRCFTIQREADMWKDCVCAARPRQGQVLGWLMCMCTTELADGRYV